MPYDNLNEISPVVLGHNDQNKYFYLNNEKKGILFIFGATFYFSIRSNVNQSYFLEVVDLCLKTQR